MDDVILEGSEIRYRYPGVDHEAVAGVSLHVRQGEMVGIVGPNGSGKTTLLRLLVGVLRPQHGDVTIAGKAIGEWQRKELARTIGVVAQREEPAFPLTVGQAVLLGRYPHMGALAAPGPEDLAAVQSALERCDVAQLSDRWLATLSGGEWQRVRVARALAQAPRVLMLDEPTASLDVRHEMEVFELVSDLVHRDGLAGVVVTHHVNLVARFVDRVVVMEGGRAGVVGPPAEVLTREVLERVFEWPVAVSMWKGVPQFVPLRSVEPSDESE
jgi:iron complex transport system ATP-binding protein